jgi:hypothetical protein
MRSCRKLTYVAVASAIGAVLATWPGSPAAGLDPPYGQLSLELAVGGTCQSSTQIAVELWMRNITGTNVTGFQAFVAFDTNLFDFNCGDSAYTNSPFPLHIIQMCNAEMEPGVLYLDGSDNFNGGGTDQDALLATLVFDVSEQCTWATFGFAFSPPFFSQLSFEGEPIPTGTKSSPAFFLDDQPPQFTFCPSDMTIECDVDPTPANTGGFCTATDNCGAATVSHDDQFVPNPAPCDYTGVIMRTWTAEDACGNTSTHVQEITLVDTTPPEIDPDDDNNPDFQLEVTVPSDAGGCESTYQPSNPTATDNCSPSIQFSCERYEGVPVSDCCFAHGTAGCNDPECEEAVCDLDEFCCSFGWDSLCADSAATLCSDLCAEGVPPSGLDCDGTVDPYDCGMVYTLRWTAVDGCGNVSEPVDQTLIVECTNTLNITIDLAGVFEPCERCIHFVADDCSTADVVLSFEADGSNVTPVNGSGIGFAFDGPGGGNSGLVGPPEPARFSGPVPLPCGDWTFVCIKDQQHTLYETTTIQITGKEYVADTIPVILRPGDTDNDSDVDINDVTWLLLTFGQLPAYGGCPWDGTRDADFNCSGDVDSADYNLISTNWLQYSTCDCGQALPLEGLLDLLGDVPPPSSHGKTWLSTTELPVDVVPYVDLNVDGRVDYKDVDIFETIHGLSDTLSTLMRESGGPQGW